MLIPQKPCASHTPHFPGGLGLLGINPCGEYVTKPLYPREWRPTMQEEVFSPCSAQWLHQLLGHKELLVSGTLPRFFGTRRSRYKGTRGVQQHVPACGEKEMMCLGGTACGQKCLQRPQKEQRCWQEQGQTQSCCRAVFTKEQMGVIHARDEQGKFSFTRALCSPSWANQTGFAQNGGILGVGKRGWILRCNSHSRQHKGHGREQLEIPF